NIMRLRRAASLRRGRRDSGPGRRNGGTSRETRRHRGAVRPRPGRLSLPPALPRRLPRLPGLPSRLLRAADLGLRVDDPGQALRFYGRCRLGDEASRLAWVETLHGRRLAELRRLSMEVARATATAT